jgi:hypothetical protein
MFLSMGWTKSGALPVMVHTRHPGWVVGTSGFSPNKAKSGLKTAFL